MHLFLKIDKIRIAHTALAKLTRQLRHHRRNIAVAAVFHRVDLVPVQRVIQGALADFLGVEQRGEHHIGHHAAMLRAITGDAVEFRFGELQLAFGKRHHRLHGTFAEGAVTHNDATLIILDRTGEDF